MQISQILLGQLAALLAIVQVIPYIHSILKGETKPSRSSYGIWLFVGAISTLSYISAGASTTKWLYIILLLNSFVLFLLSLKYGIKEFRTTDMFSIAVAVIAISIWAMTGNAAYAVYSFAVSSFFGYLPTVRKSYISPTSENKLSWGMYVVAAILNVCALTTLTPAIALPPLGSLVMSLLVYILLQTRFNKSLRNYEARHHHTIMPYGAKR